MASTFESVEEYYQSRLETNRVKLSEVKKSTRNTSLSRIIVFLLTVTGIYIGSVYSWWIIIPVAIVGTGLFVYLVNHHGQLFKKRRWHETLVGINAEEIELLNGKTDHRDKGEEFRVDDHPFAGDLDVFGDRSMFQLINRSATLGGKKELAQTLNYPIRDRVLLEDRQDAIKELSAKPDWRQQFQASGRISNERENEIDGLKAWILKDTRSFNMQLYRFLLFLNPILGLSIIALIILGYVGFGVFVLFLLIPAAIIVPKLGIINLEHNRLGRKGAVLGKFSELLGYIQNESFKTTLLRKKQETLTAGHLNANTALEELSGISAAFDYRLNLLVGLFLNVFFLWDILQMIRLEKWKDKYGKGLDPWFESLYSVDELCCFAGFAFNHPASIYPVISREDFEIRGADVKHPLIDRHNCVGNPVTFTHWKDFQVITGANMAGKSTYLRTTGVSLLLAMTGSVVLAEEFVFSPVQMFTSIKTSDSLQDGESYFFAELKRLKQMIDLLENGQQMFIILDEILRGTNSADKRKGSQSLVRQLVRLGASGMIATHDLTLGELIADFPDCITNRRFEVEIINNELHFDYKLKEGVSQNLNATFLMKKMGITID